ncbi:lysophospholipid acyltransferase family protein [Nibrella viscosa]|uniref:Lysophospholipid acyltransferase family protein n=1 Tax=Nibrella viscosa TaxID=1084524 RepID=A0ABP8JZ92_9BACT
MVFFRFLSRLPLPVLYRLADVLYVLLAYLIRYRRKTIRENLRASFPDLPATRINRLVKGFYRNLTDLIVETIKLPSLPAEELSRRVVFYNDEPVKKYLRQGRAVIGMASHQCNWEWIPPASVLNGMPTDSVYKPLKSEFFEQLMRLIRSRFGAHPLPMTKIPREMAARRHTPRIVALVADQVPDQPEYGYWMPFLHRDTPFYPGTERLARSFNLPVFFLETVRIGRGYYRATFYPVAEPPYDNLPNGAILERYRLLLEQSIHRNPADWLWSHKRWKHKREEYEGRIRGKINA